MISRKLSPFRPPAVFKYTRSNLHRYATRQSLRYRRALTLNSITDPPPDSTATLTSSISLAHPRDPGIPSTPSAGSSTNTEASTDPPPSTPSTPPPPNDAQASTSASANIPVLATLPPPNPHAGMTTNAPYMNPPFHTHQFFAALEKSFPTPTARSLMRATRALLVDRLGRVRRDALTSKDLESQAYLFKAALSELRTETTMLTRNETAAMRTASAALRREVDALGGRMKEDISGLKHDIQMELDSRKNESKNDMKQYDIMIEEVLNKALVTLGDLRTGMEEARWDNMRKSIAALSGFLFVLVLMMELLVTRSKPPKNPPPSETRPPEGEFMPL
ncbi:hypothetical protein B0H21DRAFT_717371 [Amylocystis lapponica]|nr:hypothetical protein B0H21DRAFT_717371 [Amylocystis lapponica]